MRWPAFVLLLVLAAVPAAAGERVASLGLCADQAVVKLLPRQRIAALSHQARDPVLSAVSEDAAALPALRPSAEAILMAGAEAVAADYYSDGRTLALLERLGVRVVRVPHADDFAAVLGALRAAGAALDAEAAAAALVDELERRLAVLPPLPERPLKALYLRPDGGSAGAGTAVDAALAAAGLANGAGHRRGWTTVPLEVLVLSPPDAVVTSYMSNAGWSARDAFHRHGAAARLLGGLPTVEVPGRLWTCGGWPLVEAAERLAAARLEWGR